MACEGCDNGCQAQCDDELNGEFEGEPFVPQPPGPLEKLYGFFNSHPRLFVAFLLVIAAEELLLVAAAWKLLLK